MKLSREKIIADLRALWDKLEERYKEEQEAWEKRADMYAQGYADGLAEAEELVEELIEKYEGGKNEGGFAEGFRKE